VTQPLILASGSTIRAQLLDRTGVAFSVVRPLIDEAELKHRHAGASPSQLARSLAEGKALSVSAIRRDALVIGADQVLNFDGKTYDKPASRQDARRQLLMLRGRQHALETAICCCNGEAVVWSHAVRADLAMRDFSDGFLDDYLAAVGEDVTSSAGGYKLEEKGIQLFSHIDGDYFAILGLPLLPLLEFLRSQTCVPT
jgi:septum formation protein